MGLYVAKGDIAWRENVFQNINTTFKMGLAAGFILPSAVDNGEYGI